MVREKSQRQEKKERVNGSIRSIFMHADWVDTWLMFFGFIGAVLDGFTDRLPLYFTGHMINNIGRASELDPDVLRQSLNKNAVGILYGAGVSLVACFLEGYCWTRTGERQAARMRIKYLKAVLRQDLTYFDLRATNTSEVITSISNDSLIIQDAISEKVPNLVSQISTFLGGLIVALILSWELAVVALPFVMLLAVPGWLCGRSLMNLAEKIRSEYNKAGTIAEIAISSIRTVYASGGEKKTAAEFSTALNGATKLGLRQGLVKGLGIGSSASVFAIWSFMCYYASRLVMYHGAKGGTVFASGMSIVHAGLALGVGLSNMKDIADAHCAGKRVMEVIKRVPNIDLENMEGIILEEISGKFEFKQVNFSYPSRPESVVLKNFTLTISPKKTVALVGASGSGKSTVLLLLQRFYDPLEGEILLDGIVINKLKLKWLRSQMALVSQEPSLFATTIKENILFGKEDAKMEEIIEASIASDAHNFICQLPQGYDTQVGERGVQLSGGQKQRIAIARAIIRKPQILLLDEATSALDSESERAIQKAIDKVAVGRTTIIIAHRFSTIKNVGVIIVMENGQVKEIGSHNELIEEENGAYASFIRLQRMDMEKDQQENNFGAPSESNKDFNDTMHDSRLDISKSNLTRSTAASSISLARTNNGSTDPTSPTPSFWRLLGLNKPEWKQATLGCLSAILFGAMQPLFAVAMGTTISVYFLNDHDEIKKRIQTSAFWFLGLSIFSFLINISQHYSFAYVGEYLTKRIRERMFTKILTFEVGWFDSDENSSGVICSRLAKDSNVIRSLVGDQMSLLVQAISAVTIAWTLGLVIAWRLAIVSIAVQPLIIMCFYTRRVVLKRMSRKASKEQNESSKLAAEAVSNLRIVTAFSSQERILKLLKKAQVGPRKESIRQSWIAGIVLGLSLSIKSCNWSLNFWYGGKLASEGYISPREVFQTILVLVTTGRAIAEAGSMTTILARGWDAIRSVFAILDKDTKIEPENPKGIQPEIIMGHIELSDIHFAYPTRPEVMIFQGFSIDVEAGKSMALVGKSGSGKSTIIGLIERFYDPLKGMVKIDCRDIRFYHLRSLRKHIALVNQEPTLFAGTIRENITYGALSKSISEAEVMDAARAANIHDFIIRQKEGYETWCGDRGLQLSGGQKQRIAIARAILRNPTILLLDEATSALDSHSEKLVQVALDCVMMGRTCVVVAHKLCTIQKCDQIAVLDKGHIVEKGTHSSLMARGHTGIYHSLVSLQNTDSDIAAPN